MSLTLDLFTLEPVARALYFNVADVLGADGPDADYPGRLANDFNPRTWTVGEGGGSTAWMVGLDTQIASGAQTVDSVIVGFQNITELTPGTFQWKLYYSNDGVSWSFWVAFAQITASTGPIIALPFSALPGDWSLAANKRYYGILITGEGGAPARLSMFAPARRYTINRTHQLPDGKSQEFYTEVDKISGGQEYFQATRGRATTVLRRRYLLSSQSDIDALTNAHAGCLGRARPLAITDSEATRLVRFGGDTLSLNNRKATLWEPTVEFVEVPQIAPGDVF